MDSDEQAPVSAALIGYRVGQLESSHEKMAAAIDGINDSLTELGKQVWLGKWVVGIAFGLIQPIMIAVAISFVLDGMQG